MTTTIKSIVKNDSANLANSSCKARVDATITQLETILGEPSCEEENEYEEYCIEWYLDVETTQGIQTCSIYTKIYADNEDELAEQANAKFEKMLEKENVTLADLASVGDDLDEPIFTIVRDETISWHIGSRNEQLAKELAEYIASKIA